MVVEKLTIDNVDYNECAMYLGGRYEDMPDNIIELIKKAEKELGFHSNPKGVYKVFDIKKDFSDTVKDRVELSNTSFILKGCSVYELLKDCSKVVFLCATMGTETDKFIKIAQIKDMPYAMVADAVAGAMIEAVCDKITDIIKEQYTPSDVTYRFGLGYGDFPIECEHEFLDILEAEKKIGVCSTNNYLLIPCKSVACIIGLK